MTGRSEFVAFGRIRESSKERESTSVAFAHGPGGRGVVGLVHVEEWS